MVTQVILDLLYLTTVIMQLIQPRQNTYLRLQLPFEIFDSIDGSRGLF